MNKSETWTQSTVITESEREVLNNVLKLLRELSDKKGKVSDGPMKIIHSDASSDMVGLWVNGKTASFKPSKLHDSSTMMELQAVYDSIPKIDFLPKTEWRIDNEAAVQLLIGSAVPHKPFVKEIVEAIWRSTPNIDWKFIRGSQNKADVYSRPDASATTSTTKSKYKNERADRRKQLLSKLK